MSASITPGPWVVITNVSGFESVVSRPEGATEDLVAHIYGEPGNAPLIRSALEMLEALYQYESDLLHPPEGDSRERRLERVRKVIAAATGPTTAPVKSSDLIALLDDPKIAAAVNERGAYGKASALDKAIERKVMGP